MESLLSEAWLWELGNPAFSFTTTLSMYTEMLFLNSLAAMHCSLEVELSLVGGGGHCVQHCR
jgi:hypothetical protein